MEPVGISRGRLFVNGVVHTLRKFLWPWGTLTADCPAYGLRFRFSVDDAIGRCIYCKYGVYSEHPMTQFVLHEVGIGEGDVVLDIGANIGWYALTLSSGPRPRLFAFEPDPLNYSLLKQNVELNGRANVEAVNAAVSDKPGRMVLHRYKRRNRGRHSMLQQEGAAGDDVSVETVAVDQFMKERGLGEAAVRLIKIDIEGYELFAMRGAAETLTRTSFVLTEFSPGIMRRNGMEPEAYLELLEGCGFELFVMDGGAWRPVEPALCASGEVHDLLGVNRKLEREFTWVGGPAAAGLGRQALEHAGEKRG